MRVQNASDDVAGNSCEALGKGIVKMRAACLLAGAYTRPLFNST